MIRNLYIEVPTGKVMTFDSARRCSPEELIDSSLSLRTKSGPCVLEVILYSPGTLPDFNLGHNGQNVGQ